MQNTRLSSFLNSVSIWSIVLVPLVALLGFIPFAPLWVEGSKVLISSMLISIASIAYVIEGLLAKRFSLPHMYVLLGAGVYAVTTLVATLLTKGGELSLFGLGIEAWSVSYIVASLIFFILVTIHAKSPEVRKRITYVLVFGALISIVFQLIRILSLGKIGTVSFFADPVTNTVGRWFDIGIVALLLILVSVIFYVLKANTRVRQVLTVCVFLIAFFFFAIVSPLSGLILLAIGAFLTRKMLISNTEQTTRTNIGAQTLLVVSVFACAAFIFQGLTGRSPLFFQSELVPTFSQTRGDVVYRDFPPTFMADSFTVLKAVAKESPVFGVGAARFQEAWAHYKPVTVNQTAWWATDFAMGSGILMTVGVMFGLLGLLGLLAFLYIVIRGLVEALQRQNIIEKTFALSSFVVLVYALVQTPGAGLILVLFTLIGITFSFKEGGAILLPTNSRRVFAFVVAVLVVAIPVYGMTTRTLALVYAVNAEQALAATPARLSDAEASIIKAVALVPHEVYYQALVSVQQKALADISTKITSKELVETEGTQIYNQKLIEIVQAHDASIKTNPKSYGNYLRRAQFLSNFVGQGDDATSTALAFSDVQNARILAPTNPTIDILEAQLYLLKNNGDEAQKFLLEAINKKPNYTDAALILSQLKIKQGNLKDALTAAEYAVRTNVNNSQALYIYGRLQFEAKNYLAASQAFERIVLVDGSIPLELGKLLADSYAQLGSLEQARVAYEEILKADPNNTEVKEMLLKIQEASSQSPISNTSGTTSPSVKK